MTEKSYESEWLDYVVANRRAKEEFFRRMGRLHRAYTAQAVREAHARTLAVSAR